MGTDTKLIIDDNDSYVYRLAWFIVEDDYIGGTLGEETYTEADLKRKKDPESREHIAATIAASRTVGVERDSNGYYWGSRKAASAALKACKIAMKVARAGTPWPEWAVKASAAGWKPPKGWTP